MKKIIGILILFISILLIYQNIKLDNNADNDNVYFAFYNGNEKLDTMPLKDNGDGLLFSHGECDNGASIVWNEDEWAPLVKNLTKNKTKCSLYFGKPLELGKDILPVESGDGLYAVTHDDLTEISSEWNKTEYRYAGTNPNNYVKFNNEIWRIIGLVNVKTTNGVVQRLKIVRTDGIANQKNLGNYSWDKDIDYINNWATSKLKDMLNGIYYESGIGECYAGSNNSIGVQTTCDFQTGTTLPKGLDEVARNMIDKNITWNIGGWVDANINVNKFYEKERGTSTGNNNSYPSEWNSTTDISGKFNGIGIIYPSDYAYASNGRGLGREKCFAKELFNWDSICAETSWLKPSNGFIWTITPVSSFSDRAFDIHFSGSVYGDLVYGNISYTIWIWPTLYLKSTVKILPNPNSNQEYGSIDNPFILQ